MKRTFEYRMRSNTTQEATLFTVLKASHRLYSTKKIVIEDLQPANMVRKHALALSISDSGWGMLRFCLEYNAAEARRYVEAVPPHYTSQCCSRCGEYVQKSLSVRTHLGSHCGFVADRDVNAAINILQARTGPSRSTE
jgi:putative transposase